MTAPLSSIAHYNDNGTDYVCVEDTLACFTTEPASYVSRVTVPTFRSDGIVYASYDDMKKQVLIFFGRDARNQLRDWNCGANDEGVSLRSRKRMADSFTQWAVDRKKKQQAAAAADDDVVLLVEEDEGLPPQPPMERSVSSSVIDPSILSHLSAAYRIASRNEELRNLLGIQIHNTVIELQANGPELLTVSDRLAERNFTNVRPTMVMDIGRRAAAYYRKFYHHEPMWKPAYLDGEHTHVLAYTREEVIGVVDRAIDESKI